MFLSRDYHLSTLSVTLLPGQQGQQRKTGENKQPRSKNTVSAKRKADSALQNYAEKRKEEVTPEGLFIQIIPGAQRRAKRQPSAQSQGGYEW